MNWITVLNQILDIVQEHGLPIVALVVILLWLYPKGEDVWKKAMGVKPKEHEPVQNLLKADLEITALLQEALVAFKAHWVTVWQFHNGTMSLAGVPFLRLSATHEATDGQHGGVAYLFQNLSTSLFGDNTMLMYTFPVVTLDVNNLNLNSAVRNAMLTYKFARSYMAPIKDTRGRLVGALTVSFDDHRDLEQREVDCVAEYADRAAMLLELVARSKTSKQLEKRTSEGR